MTARRVLRREYQRLQEIGSEVTSIQVDIDHLTTALDTQSNIFPGLSTCQNYRMLMGVRLLTDTGFFRNLFAP